MRKILATKCMSVNGGILLLWIYSSYQLVLGDNILRVHNDDNIFSQSKRVAATRFLVKCGCDVDLLDTIEQSPRKMAHQSGKRALIAAINLHRKVNREESRVHSAYTGVQSGAGSDSPHNGMTSTPLYALKGTKKVSNAIESRNRSHLSIVVIYGALVLILWLLTLCVPFYAWLFILFSAGLTHRYLDQDRRKDVTDSTRTDAEEEQETSRKVQCDDLRL